MNTQKTEIIDDTIALIEDDIEQIHLEIISEPITAERLKRIGQLGDSIRYARNEIKELEMMKRA